MDECIAQNRVAQDKQLSALGEQHTAFARLDVQKKTIAIAIARPPPPDGQLSWSLWFWSGQRPTAQPHISRYQGMASRIPSRIVYAGAYASCLAALRISA